MFRLDGENQKVNITKGSFRDTYNFILANKSISNRVWEQKWVVELNISENDLNWDCIWSVVHNGIINFIVQSNIWEMLHRNFICGYILKKMNRSDGICKLCNKLELQRTHIFMKCEIKDKVFDHFNDITSTFDDRAISQREKAFGIFEEINDKILLRDYTLFTILHIIYRNRNILLRRGEK